VSNSPVPTRFFLPASPRSPFEYSVETGSQGDEALESCGSLRLTGWARGKVEVKTSDSGFEAGRGVML